MRRKLYATLACTLPDEERAMEEFRFIEEVVEADFSNDVFLRGILTADEESSTISIRYIIEDRHGKQIILDYSINYNKTVQ